MELSFANVKRYYLLAGYGTILQYPKAGRFVRKVMRLWGMLPGMLRRVLRGCSTP
jgi:hypothetical protein